MTFFFFWRRKFSINKNVLGHVATDLCYSVNLESSDTEELGLALTQHFTATGPVLAFIIPSLRNQSRKDYYIFWSEAEKMARGEA